MKKTIAAILLVLIFSLSSASNDVPDLYEPGGNLCVINKENKLPASFVPADLVTPNVGTRKASLQDKIDLTDEAANALEKMFYDASLKKGYVLYAVSGYRTYGMQQLNYKAKVQQTGNEHTAGLTVVPPGASEHQLGLAMDIQSNKFKSLDVTFAETDEGKWLLEHSSNYGFILRYPKDRADITGVAYEPWHYRYVGINHAKAIKQLNLTLEEYVDFVKQLPNSLVKDANHFLLIGLVTQIMAGQKVSISYHGTLDELEKLSQPFLPDGISFVSAQSVDFPKDEAFDTPRVLEDAEVSIFSTMGD